MCALGRAETRHIRCMIKKPDGINLSGGSEPFRMGVAAVGGRYLCAFWATGRTWRVRSAARATNITLCLAVVHIARVALHVNHMVNEPSALSPSSKPTAV